MDYKLASTHSDKALHEITKGSQNIAALAIQSQWVEGDASSTENPFFKITN